MESVTDEVMGWTLITLANLPAFVLPHSSHGWGGGGAPIYHTPSVSLPLYPLFREKHLAVPSFDNSPGVVEPKTTTQGNQLKHLLQGGSAEAPTRNRNLSGEPAKNTQTALRVITTDEEAG